MHLRTCDILLFQVFRDWFITLFPSNFIGLARIITLMIVLPEVIINPFYVCNRSVGLPLLHWVLHNETRHPVHTEVVEVTRSSTLITE